jgi:hypothetical protein
MVHTIFKGKCLRMCWWYLFHFLKAGYMTVNFTVARENMSLLPIYLKMLFHIIMLVCIKYYNTELSLLLQVAGDEQPFAGPRSYGRSISQVHTTIRGQSPSNTCRIHHKSLPDLHTSPTKTNGTSSNERY